MEDCGNVRVRTVDIEHEVDDQSWNFEMPLGWLTSRLLRGEECITS